MNWFRNLKMLLGLAVVSCATDASAAILFSDNFDSYTTGTLASQGSWAATAAATPPNPLQVTGDTDKVVTFGTSGQDDFKAFSSAYTIVSGESLKSTFQINVSAAAANGDYFTHLSNPAGTTSNFYERIFARSSGAGFQLGLVAFSGTGATTTWGTTVLNFNQAYDIGVSWNFVDGPLNDTFDLSVDGAAYLTHTWNTASAEPTALAAVNFRQGTAANAPTLTINNYQVESVTAVPEPSTVALGSLFGLGLLSYGIGAAARRAAAIRGGGEVA